MKIPIGFLFLAGLITLSLVTGAGCTPPPIPNELNSITIQLKDAKAVELASRAAPDLFKLSQRYLQMAEKAYQDRRLEECIHFSMMAAVKFSSALERARILDASARRTQAEARTAAARKTTEQQNARRVDAESRISRMEKILELRQKLEEEKKFSKAERDAAESKLKAEQDSAAKQLLLMEESKKEKEVQELLAQVSSKIQSAENFEAKDFAPGDFNSAKTFAEQSKKALAEKRFQNAKDLAQSANEKATVAASKAQEQYNLKQQQLKQQINALEERRTLLAEASSIGAQARQEQRGVVITLYDMFASGKNIVLPERAFLLDKVGDLALRHPAYPMVIEGYTDSAGRDPDNLALSQGRAQSVQDYLVQIKKLEFNRVKASGYGSSNPVADNSTAEGRAKNRRIEVIFLFH